FCETARRLEERGYAFDLVSDRQLRQEIGYYSRTGLTATDQRTHWQAILVAGCARMPAETALRLADLADLGATLLLAGGLPADVPGLFDLEGRRRVLEHARERLQRHLHSGRVRIGPDPLALLAAAGVPREPMTDQGMEFVRRRHPDGTHTYFVTTPGATEIRADVVLARRMSSAQVSDPLTGERTTLSPSHRDGSLPLRLPPGGSLLLRTLRAAAGRRPAAIGEAVTDDGFPLVGPWRVTFVSGGPTLPVARTVSILSDWTTWEGEDEADRETLRAFSGMARYTVTFDLPADGPPGDRCLSLGQVCHSARVTLNDVDLGVVFCRPWCVTLPADLLRPTGNLLEIEVINLMANRLAALEREQGDAWRPFLFVNIRYQPFDAADWTPLPSGLLGPVRVLASAPGVFGTANPC
ncbi:MAG: hypothetical protein SFU56_06710, partial [Capsulimonadales bacterium]|nr:hypothetical protein [Capsulimonadales bacterium]